MPLVSCLCPTYNKFPNSGQLVNEAVESFLRQTVTDSELVIGNDCPGQELVWSGEPRVRVINYPARFDSLGAKLNAMTEASHGQWVCRWDDDDISLPNRLEWSLNQLRAQKALYVAPRRFWAKAREVMSFDYGGFATCLYLREAWSAAGKYPEQSFMEDQHLEQRIARLRLAGQPPVVIRPDIAPAEACYIYRWDTGSEHLSGYGRPNDDYNFGWKMIGRGGVQPGRYELEPGWDQDYVALVKQRAARLLLDKAAGA